MGTLAPIEPHPLADPTARDRDLALADYSDELAALDERYSLTLARLGRGADSAASAGSARALRAKASHLRARWCL